MGNIKQVNTSLLESHLSSSRERPDNITSSIVGQPSILIHNSSVEYFFSGLEKVFFLPRSHHLLVTFGFFFFLITESSLCTLVTPQVFFERQDNLVVHWSPNFQDK